VTLLASLYCCYVGLYNRLSVFHDFHVIDKASKDKAVTGSTSDVKFDFNYQPKGSDVDTQYYWSTSPFRRCILLVLVKVKKILIKLKRPSHACVETHVSLVKANMIYGRKTMIMMILLARCPMTGQIVTWLLREWFVYKSSVYWKNKLWVQMFM